MGVPKFFRYISERYPCLSELVKEYQIPEFDNLYLDMNGIIHMCSHPDDGNPHFRITEERIFKDVFHYIEVLFRMIRPQKLFFMAVDGVAPRAKMNQQRGRRFRAAKDALKQEEDAKKKGEKLPSEARFDSNCITPGTVFMARLHEQLKYFVVDKISNDENWQKCKVILSGHETPGEGEHKIMDYIRYMRAQPGYDPNTRHCLYGLDADLIMLGLCTHEPHFSLLREEVKFGKKSTKRMSVPEEITFYLLHLSLMREYLELEFYDLKDKLRGFKYDLEKIIDDWVLMGFLVGNDFIPHLPNLHIANGALPILYKAYMDILPTLDGYLNEAGSLNLARFEKFMEKLGNIDVENFEEIKDDLLYMEAKTGRKWNSHSKVSTRNLEEWAGDEDSKEVPLESLQPEKPRDSKLAELIKEADDMCLDSADETDDQSEEDDAFEMYKRDYYRNKMEYANVTPEVMRDQAEGYVRAIQWNLNYYYNGCCSWSWYYPHHYAPYISDIKGFSNLKIEFEAGQPFLPFEQLLAVLPAASKDLLPNPYHKLMTDDDSVIKQYYPEDFQTDMNGKKQEWEAVVLVPFIDENVLLEAMSTCYDYLTPEERKRNSHGPMLIYNFALKDKGPYPAPEYFPVVPHNYTEVMTMYYHDVLIPKEKLVKGAYPGVKMNVYYPGFPTMKHLKYKAYLKRAKIKVFESPSRNENMIIQVIPNEKFAGEKIPVDLIGTTVFVGWPHLVEAKVVAISNSKSRYVSMGGPGEYNIEQRTGHLIPQFTQEISGITEFYQRRWGIEVGETNVLVQVQVMIGRRYVFSPNGRLSLEKQFTQNVSNYPLQTVVFDISAYDTYHSAFRDVQNVFPQGCTCFSLTNPYYGSQGIVQDNKEPMKSGRLKISLSVLEEPDFSPVKEVHAKVIRSYKTLYNAASQLSMTNLLFSRITGSIFVTARNNEGGLKNVNVGLDLKFNKKNKETPGYTKKMGNTWLYTDRAVELVRMYTERYPEIFDYLCQDEKSDEINVEKIFKEDSDEKIKELLTWLRNLPVYSVERQTCGSEVIEPEVVEVIENIVDQHPEMKNAKKLIMNIKPNFLYRPEVQSGTLMPDPKTKTKALDRIVNVRSGFTVPLGLKGTVIAVHRSTSGSERDVMYDVVFDKPFNGGMKLNCSDGRGYRLPGTAIINISYGQRLMVEKTGKPDELIAKAEASQGLNSYNNFNSSNLPNNFTSQQYTRQQQAKHVQPLQMWRSPQHQPQYVPQNQPTFQQENSAFAQFASAPVQQRQPYANPYNAGQPQNVYESKNQKQQNYNQQQRYRGDSSNEMAQSSFTFQKSNNIFMPSFGSKQQEGSKSDQLSPEQETANTDFLKAVLKIEKNPGNNKETGKSEGALEASIREKDMPKGVQMVAMPFNTTANARHIVNEKVESKLPIVDRSQITRQTVNTEILKNLLKIGKSKNNQQSKDNTTEGTTAPVCASRNNKMDRKDVPFDMFSEAAKAPTSVRLLTYYQSNGLGLPRYQYFNCGSSIQSQITLPTGEVVIGKPARTREEASEIVAGDALEIFMKKAKAKEGSAQLTETFPVPPKTWVQPENSSPNNKECHGVNQQTNDQKRTANKNKADATVLNNSFVPLQAIKNHIGKVNNTSNRQTAEDNSLRENVQIEKSTKISDADIKDSQQERNRALQNDRRPRKERKTRIAANFVKN